MDTGREASQSNSILVVNVAVGVPPPPAGHPLHPPRISMPSTWRLPFIRVPPWMVEVAPSPPMRNVPPTDKKCEGEEVPKPKFPPEVPKLSPPANVEVPRPATFIRLETLKEVVEAIGNNDALVVEVAKNASMVGVEVEVSVVLSIQAVIIFAPPPVTPPVVASVPQTMVPFASVSSVSQPVVGTRTEPPVIRNPFVTWTWSLMDRPPVNVDVPNPFTFKRLESESDVEEAKFRKEAVVEVA